jgi:hypothetical protein
VWTDEGPTRVEKTDYVTVIASLRLVQAKWRSLSDERATALKC